MYQTRVIPMLILVFVLLSLSAKAEDTPCQPCDDAEKKLELDLIQSAMTSAWTAYQAAHPWAGNGWLSNAIQSGYNIAYRIAYIPAALDAKILNQFCTDTTYFVRPGRDFGVRCETVFLDLLKPIQDSLAASGHKFHCERLATVKQNGAFGSDTFNHVYYGIVSFDKVPGILSTNFRDIDYFMDPWADGTGEIQTGVGYQPNPLAACFKSAESLTYSALPMPSDNQPFPCQLPTACRVTGLPPRYLLYQGSASFTYGGGYIFAVPYNVDPTQRLTQLAGWDLAPPLWGNPYGNLPLGIVAWRPITLADYVGGRWRFVQKVSTTMDPVTSAFSNFSNTILANGTIANDATLTGLPGSITVSSPDGNSYPNPTGVSNMAIDWALEVSCDGNWPQ